MVHIKNIGTDSVIKIAKCASVELDDVSCTKLASGLSQVVDLFVKMEKIEVCPTKKSDLATVDYTDLRQDTIDEDTTQTAKQKGLCYRFLDGKEGYFTVPKVLNEDK